MFLAIKGMICAGERSMRRFLPGVQSAAARAFPTEVFRLQPFRDQSGGAADAGFDRYGVGRAIACAGAAFHAGITIMQPGTTIQQGKDSMRADFHTAATANAAIPVKLERCDIFKVSKAVHLLFSFSLQANKVQPHSMAAPNSAAAIIGRAILISFRTPEGDVKGVLPVKFKA